MKLAEGLRFLVKRSDTRRWVAAEVVTIRRFHQGPDGIPAFDEIRVRFDHPDMNVRPSGADWVAQGYRTLYRKAFEFLEVRVV